MTSNDSRRPSGHEWINPIRLGEWLDAAGLDGGAVTNLTPAGSGTQNIVLFFDRGGSRFVLRRPPAHPRPESNETMRREARVLKALEGTNVPHPKLIASCADESVFGVSFYVMEAVEGFNATSSLPALHRASPEIRRSMGLALADGAAALGCVDYQAVGLADFGRPQGYLQRQVSRWRSQLTGYERYGGWPGWAQLPGVEEIAAYLESRQPTSFKPGLLHGDYSLGNVLYRNDSPQLAAIIDWELATIGDPLLDLGWILCTWRGDPAGDLNVLVVEPWDGFPTPEELVDRYAQNSSRDLSRIDWYVVLACYKLAIILEGTYARACAGLDPPQTGTMLHETATLLFERALRRMERAH